MKIITRTFTLVEISAEDISDVQIVTKSNNVIVSTRIYPKSTDIDLIEAIKTIKVMLHNRTFNNIKLNPHSKIQGVLVPLDVDLYKFLPAELASNFNGRLFSVENNRSLVVGHEFTTLESIRKIFKH